MWRSRLLKKRCAPAKVREAARKAKDVARAKNAAGCRAAGGQAVQLHGPQSAKKTNCLSLRAIRQAAAPSRDATAVFRRILPLRGKPLNVEKKRLDQVLANEEFRSIITALGTGIGEDFDIKRLKYYKVIILSDADQDGAHIRAILLTFFYRYMRELITDGHVYIGMPPLYRSCQGQARLLCV